MLDDDLSGSMFVVFYCRRILTRMSMHTNFTYQNSDIFDESCLKRSVYFNVYFNYSFHLFYYVYLFLLFLFLCIFPASLIFVISFLYQNVYLINK